MTIRERLKECPKCMRKPCITVHIGRPGYSIGCDCQRLDICNNNVDTVVELWNYAIKE